MRSDINDRFRFNIFVRAISAFLVISFLHYDMSWAFSAQAYKDAQNTKLAPQSFFSKNDSIRRASAYALEQIIENGAISKQSLTTHAVKAALNKHRNEKWFINNIAYTTLDHEVLISFSSGFMLRYYDPTALSVPEQAKYSDQIESAGEKLASIRLNNYLHKELLRVKALPENRIRPAGAQSGSGGIQSSSSEVPYKQIFLSCEAVNGQTLEEQTKSLLMNIDNALAENGCDRDSVVKQIVFLKDLADKKRAREMVGEHYGRSPPSTSYVIQPPANKNFISIEITAIPKSVGAKIERVEDSKLTIVTHDGIRWANIAGLEPKEWLVYAYDQAYDIFSQMRTILEKNGFKFEHVVRTWIYQGDITGSDELNGQKYDGMNLARWNTFRPENAEPVQFADDFIRSPLGKLTPYPASTGISMADGDIVMECLALSTDRSDVGIRPLTNPRQTEVYDYPDLELYGKKVKPLFSRGTEVTVNDQTITFVSGTASIIKEKSTGEDPAAQTENAIDNVALVLKEAGAKLEDLGQVRIYVKNRSDYEKVREVAERRLGSIPRLYVIAGVCRKNLLVELEGIAYTIKASQSSGELTKIESVDSGEISKPAVARRSGDPLSRIIIHDFKNRLAVMGFGEMVIMTGEDLAAKDQDVEDDLEPVRGYVHLADKMMAAALDYLDDRIAIEDSVVILSDGIVRLARAISSIKKRFNSGGYNWDPESRKNVEILIEHTETRVLSSLQDIVGWMNRGMSMTSIESVINDVLYSICDKRMISAKAEVEIKIDENLKKAAGLFTYKLILRLAIEELLLNALKYSKAEKYTIAVSLDKDGKLKIDVVDQGIGISRENLEKIFKPDSGHFTTAKDKITGTGYGLSALRATIESVGGNMNITSEVGLGTVSSFVLPVNASPDGVSVLASGSVIPSVLPDDKVIAESVALRMHIPNIYNLENAVEIADQAASFLTEQRAVLGNKSGNIDDVLMELGINIMEHGNGGDITVSFEMLASGVSRVKIVGKDDGISLPKVPDELVRDSLSARARGKEETSDDVSDEDARGQGFSRIALDPDNVVIEYQGRRFVRFAKNIDAGVWFREEQGSTDPEEMRGTRFELKFNLETEVDGVVKAPSVAEAEPIVTTPLVVEDQPRDSATKMINAIHNLFAFGVYAKIRDDSRVLLSESLFIKDGDESGLNQARIALAPLLNSGYIAIMSPNDMRRAAMNQNVSKDKLAIVLTEEDFRNPDIWNDSDKETSLKSSVLIVNDRLTGDNYLYLEGVIGLAHAVMANNKQAIKSYYRLISGIDIDDAILALLGDGGQNNIAFAVKAILSFKAITNIDPKELRDLRIMMENFLISA